MKWQWCWFLLFWSSETSGITLRLGLDDGAGEDLAAALDFAEVVRVGVGSGGAGGRTGSGVLLNREWVLTAGHVVQAGGAEEITISGGGMRRGVTRVVSHPGWSAASVPGPGQGSDLVLLKLSSPVAHALQVPLWRGGGSGPLVGMMAGYGRGGNGLLGAYAPEGTLRAGFNVVDRFLPAGEGAFWVTDFDSGQVRHNSLHQETVDLRHFDADGREPPLSEVLFSGPAKESLAGFQGLPAAQDFFPGLGDSFPEATTARGDSGGPLFLYSAERSQWELAGVTSFGVNPLYQDGFQRSDSRYGDLSFFADVSGQAGWIGAVVIPEPTTAMLMLGGLGGLWTRKRTLP